MERKEIDGVDDTLELDYDDIDHCEDGIQVTITGDDFNSDIDDNPNSSTADSEFEGPEMDPNQTEVMPDAESEVQFNVQLPVEANPAKGLDIESYVQSMVDRRWEQKEKEIRLEWERKFREGTGVNASDDAEKNNLTPTRPRQVDRIKSPSDTTIYAPGLNKTPDKGNGDGQQ